MPNRRRRRLSTATSAFAALAVASPFAYIAVCDLTAKPAPVHHEFVRAASMTDLPGELMGALTQGLSQFGVSLPPIPSLTGATSSSSPSSLGLPGLGSPDLSSPQAQPQPAAGRFAARRCHRHYPLRRNQRERRHPCNPPQRHIANHCAPRQPVPDRDKHLSGSGSC